MRNLAAILFVVVIIALKAGAVEVSLFALGRDLIRVIVHHGGEIKSDYGLIVMNIRLPRILLGIFVGASLAVAGTGFQALLRNPLADPYVLGVSNGAALGAILALVSPHLALLPAVADLLTPLGAFLGAAATIAAVYFLGRREGQIDSTTLLLGGIITASFLAAVIMFLMTSETGSNLRGMAYWLMGNLSTSLQPACIGCCGLVIVVASGAIYTTASDLNLLLSGEKEAMHLGRGRAARTIGRIYSGIRADGARGFRERRHWLRGVAGAARDAPAFWIGSPHIDSYRGSWWRDRGGDCRYHRAHHCVARGASGRGDDGVVWRAAFYLFAAQEDGVTLVARPPASATIRSPLEAARANNDVRLSVEQVSYAYSPNPTQAPLFTLEATSFQARAGEIVAILGPNASGKSTLLKLIAGTLEPLSGRVLLNGFATHSLTARTRAQRIAMVQQESPLLFPSRAWEFVLQGRHPHGRALRFESDGRGGGEKCAGASGCRGTERPLDGGTVWRREAAGDSGAGLGAAAAAFVAG